MCIGIRQTMFFPFSFYKYIQGLLETFADKFDCERTIPMILAKLFKINLDVFPKKYVKICQFLIAP